jgi:hypothetical protein
MSFLYIMKTLKKSQPDVVHGPIIPATEKAEVGVS